MFAGVEGQHAVLVVVGVRGGDVDDIDGFVGDEVGVGAVGGGGVGGGDGEGGDEGLGAGEGGGGCDGGDGVGDVVDGAGGGGEEEVPDKGFGDAARCWRWVLDGVSDCANGRYTE